MYALTIYCLKVGACLAVFYLFFKLLLSRETFHRLNRIVILSAMLLSFLLPVCVVTVYRDLPMLPTPPPGEELPQIAVAQQDAAAPVTWREIVGVLFLLGGAASLCWTLSSLWGVARLIGSGRRERTSDGEVIVRTASTAAPFSWGRYIVLPEPDTTGNESAVLLHEKAHIRLHHSWDLLATDIAGCLQWFNPAMWLLRRELRAIHEYEADEAVLDSGIDARQYQLLLIKKAAGGRWCSVANSFNHSKLKNRITMMLRKRSSRWAVAKTLLLLPLTSLAVGAFARTVYRLPEDKVTKESVSTLLPEEKNSPEGTAARPLYVVDGRQAESIDTLSPDRIASITVRKDAETTAAYGQGAEEGVILIETKKPGLESQLNGSVRSITIKRSDDDAEAIQAAAQQSSEAALEAARTGVDMAAAGLQMARATLESLRGQLTDREWEERMLTLNEAQQQLDEAREQTEAQRAARQQRIVVVSSSSQEGSAADKKETNPLVVIDGAISDRKRLNDLAPDQIESIDVLKDNSAVELYGAQGADGAILVRTKQGGSLSISSSITTRTDGPEAEKGSTVEFTGNIKADAGKLADRYAVYVNGRRATKAQAARIPSKKIKRMTIYKGQDAAKKFGAEYTNGVVEISTRK